MVRRFTLLSPLSGCLALLLGAGFAGCTNQSSPPLSHLHAVSDTPLYTTYAAARERSEFILDEGYQFQFTHPDQPLEFITDSAGKWGFALRDDTTEAVTLDQWAQQPEITLSYPDMVQWQGKPFDDLEVRGTLVVHSSRLAIQEYTFQNRTRFPRTIHLLLYLRKEGGVFSNVEFESGGFTMRHREPPDDWTVKHEIPAFDPVFDLVLVEPGFITIPTFRTDQGSSTKTLSRLLRFSKGESPTQVDSAKTVAIRIDIEMLPMARRKVRILRGVAGDVPERDELRGPARLVMASDFGKYVRQNETLFQRVQRLRRTNDATRLLYWSAWSMMRQVMLPPESGAPTNYYVFSREPTWGWGHGGQVFHESLTMMAYALADRRGAMDSQRLFALRQDTDGYIPYRIGPYLSETIVTDSQRTTSAPWYAWTNWEVYRLTRDREFLEQMYASSKRFYRWYTSHRDRDGDGLCEWGGQAMLESVRDARVAVWDQVTEPDDVEGLDLNCMLVMEANSLAKMAHTLGLDDEAAQWKRRADARAEKVRDTMWDEDTGFFYNVSLKRNDFTIHSPGDLKRKEIIGFLPLWAGIATEKQAKRLVLEHLLNSSEFWRPYGVPSLSADDPYYDPRGYWNGPVWVEWNYLVERGLCLYGYDTEARTLVQHVTSGMTEVLQKTHTLWEFYSPDEPWGGWHSTYIWAGLINRMLLDANDPPVPLQP